MKRVKFSRDASPYFIALASRNAMRLVKVGGLMIIASLAFTIIAFSVGRRLEGIAAVSLTAGITAGVMAATLVSRGLKWQMENGKWADEVGHFRRLQIFGNVGNVLGLVGEGAVACLLIGYDNEEQQWEVSGEEWEFIRRNYPGIQHDAKVANLADGQCQAVYITSPNPDTFQQAEIVVEMKYKCPLAMSRAVLLEYGIPQLTADRNFFTSYPERLRETLKDVVGEVMRGRPAGDLAADEYVKLIGSHQLLQNLVSKRYADIQITSFLMVKREKSLQVANVAAESYEPTPVKT